MDVTKRLQKLDPTLKLSSESKWDEPDVAKKGYHSFNDAGVEIEVGEFLYSMVRVLKPANVLETGTHWGIGASYMGQALKDNGEGHLDTIEFLPEIASRATKRILDLDLTAQVTIHLTDARAFNPPEDWRGSNESAQMAGLDQPTCKYDLILLDTEPQTRFEELIRFFDFLTPGGFVFIHDLHRHMHQIPNEEHGFAWPFGKIPETIKQWVKRDRLRPFHFPTPRGFTGFYKPNPKDYQWNNTRQSDNNIT